MPIAEKEIIASTHDNNLTSFNCENGVSYKDNHGNIFQSEKPTLNKFKSPLEFTRMSKSQYTKYIQENGYIYRSSLPKLTSSPILNKDPNTNSALENKSSTHSKLFNNHQDDLTFNENFSYNSNSIVKSQFFQHPLGSRNEGQRNPKKRGSKIVIKNVNILNDMMST